MPPPPDHPQAPRHSLQTQKDTLTGPLAAWAVLRNRLLKLPGCKHITPELLSHASHRHFEPH